MAAKPQRHTAIEWAKLLEDEEVYIFKFGGSTKTVVGRREAAKLLGVQETDINRIFLRPKWSDYHGYFVKRKVGGVWCNVTKTGRLATEEEVVKAASEGAVEPTARLPFRDKDGKLNRIPDARINDCQGAIKAVNLLKQFIRALELAGVNKEVGHTVWVQVEEEIWRAIRSIGSMGKRHYGGVPQPSTTGLQNLLNLERLLEGYLADHLEDRLTKIGYEARKVSQMRFDLPR